MLRDFDVGSICCSECLLWHDCLPLRHLVLCNLEQLLDAHSLSWRMDLCVGLRADVGLRSSQNSGFRFS